MIDEVIRQIFFLWFTKKRTIKWKYPSSSAGSARSKRSRRVERGSRLESSSLLQKKKIRRKSVRPFSGGGQEIRNTPETFHLVPPSVKKSGFKPFLHIHISSAFTAFHQNKGHVKDTESSSSTAAVTRQRLFLYPSSVQEVNKYTYSSIRLV